MSTATQILHNAYQQLHDLPSGGLHRLEGGANALRVALVERARQRSHNPSRDERPVGMSTLTPDEEAVYRANPRAVQVALERLARSRPEQHEVAVLRVNGGLGYADISRTLGISIEKTRSRWTFARALLMRELARRS